MYVERPSLVPGAVVWRSTGAAAFTVVPDGCMDLIWFGDRLIVAGPDTRPQPTAGPPVDVVGLRFAPGTAPSALGVPAHALRDARVPLSEMWAPVPARQTYDQVATAVRRGQALEQVAGPLVEAGPAPAWVTVVVGHSAAGFGTGAIAAGLGWSERTLHRHARQAFGYGTATLARILRFRRASDQIRNGRSLGDVAADTGYADQPHLSREVRALSGRSPSQLRR